MTEFRFFGQHYSGLVPTTQTTVICLQQSVCLSVLSVCLSVLSVCLSCLSVLSVCLSVLPTVHSPLAIAVIVAMDDFFGPLAGEGSRGRT